MAAVAEALREPEPAPEGSASEVVLIQQQQQEEEDELFGDGDAPMAITPVYYMHIQITAALPYKSLPPSPYKPLEEVAQMETVVESENELPYK